MICCISEFVLFGSVTWKLRISVRSLLFFPCLLELKHTEDHVPQLTPQEVASSGGGGPGALQHRLNQKHDHMVTKLFNSETFFIAYRLWVWFITHLVVVPICDSIGLNSSFFHLKQHPNSQDRLAVLATQLQQHTVTHLEQKRMSVLKDVCWNN